MQYRIVADSSSNVFELPGADYAHVPLKIINKGREYVDEPGLEVFGMLEDLKASREGSSTSCPNAFEWEEAFGDADGVFAVTITSNLSGSYSAARAAADHYMEEHPDRRVCVIDSRNTGPGMKLLGERIFALLHEGLEFDEICDKVNAYRGETELLFLLESLNNLANNGRVSRTVALLAGLLGVRLLGRAVDGQIKPVAKPRGEKKALEATVREMEALGYSGGKLRISHNQNEAAASTLSNMIRAKYPDADVEVYSARALCSFYAEKGGIILGFEIKKN